MAQLVVSLVSPIAAAPLQGQKLFEVCLRQLDGSRLLNRDRAVIVGSGPLVEQIKEKIAGFQTVDVNPTGELSTGQPLVVWEPVNPWCDGRAIDTAVAALTGTFEVVRPVIPLMPTGGPMGFRPGLRDLEICAITPVSFGILTVYRNDAARNAETQRCLPADRVRYLPTSTLQLLHPADRDVLTLIQSAWSA